MSLPAFLIICMYSFIIQSQVMADGDINIKVAQGELVGEWRNIGGRDFGAFEGIPFAVPPLGEKRFMEPEPISSWNGVLQVKTPSNVCTQLYDVFQHQIISYGEEDCLYLNVYSPKPISDEKLPVIVVIHAGTFMFGVANHFGCDFLMEKDVVCASINFRVGAIGFLSTEDEVVPGNNGLKDQLLALKWIKENIGNFGGNSDSITLVGPSSGGASITYHTISPLSKGLFHRAILSDGSACSVWTLSSNAKSKAQAVAESFGCPITSSREMIDCLKQKPAMEITRSAKMFTPFIQSPLTPFGPTIEPPGTKGAIITEHPIESLKKGLSVDIPMLYSINMDNGLVLVSIFLHDYKVLDEIEERWDEIFPYLYNIEGSLSSSEYISAAKKIKDAYFNGKSVSFENYPSFTDSFSDRLFNYGSEECSKLNALHHKEPVYFYQFSYSGEGSFTQFFSSSDNNYGVCHLDDVGYVFNNPAFDPRKVSEDNKMMLTMVEMYAEFATHGKPKLGTTEWIPLTKDEFNYMNITGPDEFYMTTKKITKSDVWRTLNI